MRIIGGSAGGRRLQAPPGDIARPTSDRVREALFSILGPPAPGSRVLDLFAGSGALGLEALSRGAGSAVFVDRAPQVLRVLRQNISALGMDERVTVLRSDALAGLRRLPDAPFAWVFLDPPYATDLGPRALAQLAESALITEETVVVLEHDRRRVPPPSAGCLVKADSRRYGDTELSLYRQERP